MSGPPAMTPEQRDVERAERWLRARYEETGEDYSSGDERSLTEQLQAVRAEATRAASEPLVTALRSAISVASEAAEEWDKAPQGMRAGKLLLALCGHLKGYRADITAIHAALAAATALEEG